MSRAFKFLIQAREKFYESGILKTSRLHHPVVSVGNLTLGGTGKTPLVIALSERFLKEGARPVVLSRGYKRASSGVLVVSRGGGPLVSWEEAGDEPFLIAESVPGVSVVVGSDRCEAGSVAERENLGDLFILDDGFQHRRLHRNVDLLTIDPVEWNAGERLLPVGRWREPKSAATRAHAALVQSASETPPELPIPAFAVETVMDGIFKGSQPVDIETLRGRSVVAFAGIAKPDRFFDALEKLGLRLAHRVRFRDHHKYTAAEITSLGGDLQITTHKDAVRLRTLGLPDFLHLRISAKIPEFNRLMQLIRSRFP
jgi:tetraacyldisaccharide 4'-kinase